MSAKLKNNNNFAIKTNKILKIKSHCNGEQYIKIRKP